MSLPSPCSQGLTDRSDCASILKMSSQFQEINGRLVGNIPALVGILGLRAATVRRMCQSGKLQGAYQLNGSWMIPVDPTTKMPAFNYPEHPKGRPATWAGPR